ncbi:MAG TPA: hypothetical protein VF263_02100 [Longimicrobiaceae bacterium]
MERAIELLAAVNFIVIGLSHIVQPRVWAEFFLLLRSKGEAGSFVNGFLSLATGSLIVGFHNVWSGIPLVLTLIGWAQVLKSLLIFVVPGYGLRGLSLVSADNARIFVAPGVALVGVGGLLLYSLLASPG